uniref:Phospholipase D n=1 Tax=Araucaria cunninghamii TaxID=56994 RepID=A0A0D6QSJ5_ARACU
MLPRCHLLSRIMTLWVQILLVMLPYLLRAFCLEKKIEDWFPVLNVNGKVCKGGAALKLSIQYFPIENQALYRFGIGAGPDYAGVPNTYFPLRKGGKVTLYQDAHVPDNLLPRIELDHQVWYEHSKCWQDICEAILQARRLIYITGWSIFDKIQLVRGSNNLRLLHSDFTLGDLLKFKSQEGLRVLLLVWDDPTSRSILGYKTEGLMQTHDEETRRFFKHSSVQVFLCPRQAGKKHSWVKQQEVGTIFTHHQKTVILDTQSAGGRRKITAFLGGLDLCDGRYDNPEHNLFRTLQTVHKDDYHNPTFTAGIDSGGPREPWHDLHCKIDGLAAYDVLMNFEQRWTKAAKRHGLGKLKRTSEDSLLRLERLPDIIGISEVKNFDENDPETWHVQIFRSIDSSSVKGFPKDSKDVEARNLVSGKNVVIDMSIHTAYVEAIRSAQHFIYIENQYFIGSSYNWRSHKDIGANNMIPMELALKIAEKIRAHERFAVYILVPMWPEGIPTSMAMQRILYWQGQTMEMMYETIFKALKEVDLEQRYHPQDYLNFFCLGNREARDGNEAPVTIAPPENTPHARAQKNRRFMIYVHSKGMIVDDEYVIMGSANINQRSMDGSRDTEIAMGAYQPQYTWAKKRDHPHGQVYGYRMSLWAEHLGMLEDCFQHPESLECVRRVREISEYYWKQFSSEIVIEMKGHLMKYPVMVEPSGKVKPLPGSETFPDIGGNILGTLGTPAFVQENLTI